MFAADSTTTASTMQSANQLRSHRIHLKNVYRNHPRILAQKLQTPQGHLCISHCQRKSISAPTVFSSNDKLARTSASSDNPADASAAHSPMAANRAIMPPLHRNRQLAFEHRARSAIVSAGAKQSAGRIPTKSARVIATSNCTRCLAAQTHRAVAFSKPSLPHCVSSGIDSIIAISAACICAMLCRRVLSMQIACSTFCRRVVAFAIVRAVVSSSDMPNRASPNLQSDGLCRRRL